MMGIGFRLEEEFFQQQQIRQGDEDHDEMSEYVPFSTF